MAGKESGVGEIQALRSKVAQERTQSVQLKQQAQANQQQAAQARQEAASLHSQASSIQVGGGDTKEAQAAAEQARARKEALQSKAQAADQKAQQLQDRFTQQTQQAQKLETAVRQDEQKIKQLMQAEQKKKEQEAKKPTLEKARAGLTKDYKDLASIEDKLRQPGLDAKETYSLLKQKVAINKDLKKLDNDLTTLKKEGAEINPENLKAEAKLRGRVEARYEKFQTEAESRIQEVNDLEDRLDEGRLSPENRARLEKEIGNKRAEIRELRKSYEEDIGKERLTIKADPWGSRPTNGQERPNDCLDHILKNQGYTEEEIYKDGGALLKRVAKENNISDPDTIMTGAELTIPPSSAKLSEMSKESEHQGIVTTKPDGTTVREMLDGTRITTKPDGTTVKEYEKDGTQVSQTSYEKDGANVTETVSRFENGDVTEEAVVEKDGIVDRTVRKNSTTDGTIEDLLSEEQAESLEGGGISDGNRDRTKVTTVTREITDTTKKPPETKRVLESTSYSQHIRSDGEPEYGSGLESIDRDASGQTLTFTKSKYLDGKGREHEAEVVGSTKVVAGKTPDGRDASSSETTTFKTVDGKPAETVKSTEFKGMFDRDTAGMISGVSSKSDYMERLKGDHLNVRMTSITRYDENGEPHEEKIREVGDYDKPDQDGNTVVVDEVDDKTLWTYRKVSDGGHHVQSQTGIEGTNARIINDSVRNDDGTFKDELKVYGDDNVVLSHRIRERKLVDASQLKGDAEYQGEFLKNNAGGKIYEDRAMNQEWDMSTENGKLTTTDVRQYTAEGSSDRLTTVLELGDGEPKRTTLMESGDPGVPPRLRSDADGAEYSLDAQGRLTFKVDGVTTVLPSLEGDGGPGAFDAAKGGGQSATNLVKALREFTTKTDAASTAGAATSRSPIPTLPKSASGAMAALGLITNTVGLASAIREGDAALAVSSGGEVAASLGTLSELGSVVLADTSARAAGILGVAGKTLGGAGAVVGIGYGYYEISQGNTVDGALDIAGGVGAGIAVFAASTAWTGVGLVIAGGALVAKLIYDEHQSHKTAELEI